MFIYILETEHFLAPFIKISLLKKFFHFKFLNSIQQKFEYFNQINRQVRKTIF